ncbi:ABC transporter ATP-binding protein [Agrobacterium tumefaciens]|uniref:ABC transporter ATP-binding protein n=1 Tax=Agrobacterium tumefaciens TaxID=358 RepID=UPI0021FF37F6|nr:sn-glycerol-3-phosphate ABC transporter ATP-binding protein UgpC [Agrobacterium tumefaciens]
MATLSIRQLVKRYEIYTAVHGIDLEINDNEFIVLVGPSGCGKSTTLRMIAGLEDISGGEIRIGDRRINDVAPGDRDIAMVFQNYALYPHMTVYDNIAFGLKQRRTPKAEIEKRVADAARILDIAPLLNRKPRMLSGGQRQRVAMGRALVRNPQVFLFDEPLSNLDAKLRVQMRTEIKRLHQLVPTTTVYVTHDQIEAMTMADRVVIMNGGRIEQVGTPQDLYHHPKSKFVAGFIGSPAMNFLPVEIIGHQDGLGARLENGSILALPADRQSAYGLHRDRKMLLGLRPEHITEPREKSESAALTAHVDLVEPLGLETLTYFSVAGVTVCARLDPMVGVRTGQDVQLAADMRQMHLIDPETELVVPV